ncbi:MAG: hypothetical protein ACETWK_14040 [Candidatus Aminicenantaceae bacterium]
MKKLHVPVILLTFSLAFFPVCAKKPSAPTAGTAKAEDMLNLIPKDVNGVIAIDIHRAMSAELIDKFLKEEKAYENYQKLVEETGIDPKKDIYLIVGGLTGDIAKAEKKAGAEGVFLINLKYDKETLLNKIKKEEAELLEEDYNGITIYSPPDKVKKPVGAFLDDSNIVLGSEKDVKVVIDLYQNKGENVLANENLAAIIEKTNKDALFWAAILFPPETMQKVSAENPMLKTLETVTSTSIYFDYKDKNILADIKVISRDEAKNKDIVNLLNGLKAMGSMAVTEDPNIGELLDSIEITSSADAVQIHASIPEQLIEKLKKKKEKAEEVESY